MDHESAETLTIEEKASGARYGGVSAYAFFIPAVILLVILHVIIIVLIFSINTESGKLSQTMQNSSVYTTDATSMLGGSSLLSETSSNYVFMPITVEGEPNVGPLVAYTNELGQTDHRGDQVVARFKTYQVDDQVMQDIEQAAQSANELITAQLHAIALTSSVYPLPDIPPLAGLELPELSSDEAALSDADKLARARTLLLDSNYGSNKSAVSTCVNEAVGIIRASSGALAESAGKNVSMLRTLLWVFTILTVIYLTLLFIALYRMFISPIGRFSKRIVKGDTLDDTSGLKEMRVLASSYNNLLDRHDALEGILREAAETDPLTGLPNRYSLQQQMLDAKDKDFSIAVFLFDVDNLKHTNDTFGHAAGDDLLRRSAHCMATCFGSTDDGACYRIGGDEFVAIVRNIEENEIPPLLQEFKKMQEQNDVSISYGYSYAQNIGSTTFKALMDEADSKLYQMKAEVHSREE